jgi:hypothetical protein
MEVGLVQERGGQMSIKPVQNQFNGGEISPLMSARFDLPIYQYAAQKLINNIPVSEGCYKRRGGTHFVSEAKTQDALLFKINVTPEDAQVVIDGANTREAYLAYGDEVDYTIIAEGYSTIYGKYQVKENTELNISMVSLVQRAKFNIIPTPADAEVIINGVKRTEANIGVNGKVSYSVSKEGYDTKQGEFVITKDTTLEIKIDCIFEVICLDFSDAMILINGVEQSMIRLDPPQTVSWEVRHGDIVKTGKTLVDKSKKEYVLLDEDGEVFNYIGAIQTYIVPQMVKELEVDCVGAAGFGNNKGLGGRVQAKLKVTGGETLYVYVGKQATSTVGKVYNASDIRTLAGEVTGNNQLRSRLLVAGGGGCSGTGNGVGKGGNGGGLNGGSGGDTGCCGGGQGGRQTTGGAAGRDIPWTSQNTKSGGEGQLGLGGVGVSNSGVGGAGGAGYYGGGGGRGGYTKDAGSYGAGGGGGSSYAGSRCVNVIHTQGYVNAVSDGYVSIKPIVGEF